MHAWVVWRIG
jgi:hypothetical protein